MIFIYEYLGLLYEDNITLIYLQSFEVEILVFNILLLEFR